MRVSPTRSTRRCSTKRGLRYYANILLPYSPLVTKLLNDVGEMNLDIAVIAPDHGPVWREDLGRVLGWYGNWAGQKPADRAVVIYDTMWGSTDSMARAVADGIIAGGSSVKMMSAAASHRSDAIFEIARSGAVAFGSSTLNNGLLPRMADYLTYIKGLKPLNKIGAAFGSYGWSGEAPKLVAETMKEMNIELVDEPLRVKYVPNAEALEQCCALGRKIAARLKETCK